MEGSVEAPTREAHLLERRVDHLPGPAAGWRDRLRGDPPAEERVGAKQIKKGAVTPAKLSAAARASLIGATGQKGATGDPGAQGPQGKEGKPGLSALSTLPAGDSESSAVAAVGNNVVAGQEIEDTVTFPVPLAEGLAGSHVVFTTVAGTAHCPGEGHAEGGYLCIYVTSEAMSNTRSP